VAVRGKDTSSETRASGTLAPSAARPSAVLAEASPLTRLAMRHALERVQVAVAGEAADVASAIGAVLVHRPALCLLAVDLPGDAIAAVDRIALSAPMTRVVTLFEPSAEELAIEALHAGAKGCLPKDIGPDALGRAVLATLDGEVPLPRAAIARVIEELRVRAGERRVRTVAGTWTTLSERESQVLALLRRKRSTGEIAAQLGISDVTVRRHVSATMRRLGVRSRDAALRLATSSEERA
jgi:DNA-binding NarL/FixJ family response regulator